MAPFDPTNPLGLPNPEPTPQRGPLPKPEIQKLTLEDLLDIEKIKQQMESLFKTNFRTIGMSIKREFKTTFTDVQKIEQQYIQYTSTAERNKYRTLVQEKNNLKQKIKETGVIELDQIRRSTADGTQKENVLKAKRLEIVNKLKQVELTKEKEIKDAKNAALLSEKSLIGQARGGFGALVSKSQEYAKSLLNTKSLWEAMIVLLISAAGRTTEIAKTSTALRRAGVNAERGGGVAAGTTTRLFGGPEGIGTILGKSATQMNQWVQQLADAPKLLEENQKDLTQFIGVMGDFGFGVEESIGVAVTASNSWGARTKELTSTLMKASVITKMTGMNTREAFNMMLRLRESMRGLTFDTSAADTVVATVSSTLKKLNFRPDEIQKFADNIGNALAQMSPTKLAGLIAFTKGGRLPNEAEITKGAARGLGTIVAAYKPILDTFEKGSAARLGAIESIGKEFGIFGTQNIKAFGKVIDEFGTNTKTAQIDFKKLIEPPKTLEDLQKRGFATMLDTMGPLTNIEDGLKKILEGWSSQLIPAMQKLNDVLPKLSSALTLGGGPLSETNFGGGMPGAYLKGKYQTNLRKHQRGTAQQHAAELMMAAGVSGTEIKKRLGLP